MHKKEIQWKEYMATSGLDFDIETNQPKMESIQINILKDTKTDVINKIKDITINEFQKIEVKKDGNCLPRAILKSIKENELYHPELRQIITDIILEEDFGNIEELFKEENCKNKEEYAKKIRKDGYYLGDIVL